MKAHLHCVLCGGVEVTTLHTKEIRRTDNYSIARKAVIRLYTCGVCEKLLFPADVEYVKSPEESHA